MPESFNAVIIAYHNGAPVHVSDIGKAVDGVEDVRQAAWLGKQRAVIIDVHKQPGYNVNATVQLVKDALPGLQRSLPPSIKMQVLGDRTQTIRASVTGVQGTMAISVALVVLVVFLFLRDAAATLIPSVTIPVSLLCTCAVMYLLGYTLDNVSLMALTIAVGFIIDDGIVMVENVIRHVEGGKAPTEAALVGSREIGFTIVSMTLSLVAVFIPLLLMGGLVGRLFREFAVTVSVAILMSGVVSLTLTPMMCSRLLRPAGRRPDARVAAWPRGMVPPRAWLLCSRAASAPGHRPAILVIMAATLGRDRLPLPRHSQRFLPAARQWAHRRQHRGGAGHLVCRHGRARERAGRDRHGRSRRAVGLLLGAAKCDGQQRPIMIDLKPISERQSSAAEVLRPAAPKPPAFPASRCSARRAKTCRVGAEVARRSISTLCRTPNVAELFKWAPIVLARLSALPN